MARRTAKSPEAFRTISEAADSLDLPQHVLRFWETRFSQIKPMKRSGGRRYYRPADISLLQGIKHLLYDEGYTIKGVQRILREQGVAHVVALGEQTGTLISPRQEETATADEPSVENGAALRSAAPGVQTAEPRPAAFAAPAELSSAPSESEASLPPQTVASPAVQQHRPTGAPDHPRAAAEPSTPLAGPTLRFVPDPVVEADAQSAISNLEQTVPSNVPVSGLPPLPSQPLPDPLPSPITPEHQVPSAGSNGVTSPAATFNPPPQALPPQPHSTIPPGAVSPSLTLNAHQTQALVSALRTLMDCKSQLDHALPIKQHKITSD